MDGSISKRGSNEKKRTQKQRILSYIRKRKATSPSRIARALGINPRSVRGRMSELRAANKIPKSKRRPARDAKAKKRVKAQKVRVADLLFRRKIVKPTAYCNRKQETYFGITYESNKRDRSDFLLRKIEDFTQDRCSDLVDKSKFSNWGYDDQSTTSSPPFIFPEFEVGVE